MKLLNFRYECNDALTFMKKLPDNSISLIISSPPYNVGKEYESQTKIEEYLENMKPVIVFDPFAGVGSTLLGALKNNRRAYGTELESRYVKIGLSRIDRLKSDTLKTRPIYQKIYIPTGNEKVSQVPDEWKVAQ